VRLLIDADRCEGHGRCYVLFPGLFGADEEGNGEVVIAELGSPELVADAETAAKNCPERAISVTPGEGDADGG
jgi:ferredoxin